MSFKQWFREVRDIFWPMIDPPEGGVLPIKTIKVGDCIPGTDTIDTEIKAADEYFDYNQSRKKTTETKATTFLYLSSIAIFFLAYFTRGLLFDLWMYGKSLQWILVGGIVITFIYLLRTVLLSIRALSRIVINVVGCPDFLWSAWMSKDYMRRLFFVSKYNATQANVDIINRKVETVVLAQESFARAIIIFVAVCFVMMFI